MLELDSLVAAAVVDEGVRSQLLADPATTARKAGIALPAGVKLVVHEDTAEEVHLVLGGSTDGLTDEAQRILEQARQDAGFKARLLKDAAAAIRADFGPLLPAGLTVVVHENQPGVLHIVLPAPVSSEGELSTAELDAVAGGRSSISHALKKVSKILKSKGLSQLPSTEAILEALGLRGR